MTTRKRVPTEAVRRGTDYTSVTEVPGLGASGEQMSMLVTRYNLASDLCVSKDVLEIACGSGIGLGYMAQKARRVVGGDLNEHVLRIALRHYDGRIPLVRLDAERLPFAKQTFDVVVLYEAIYYLATPGTFLDECQRILRHGGTVAVCSVNREWPDFNPSPFSHRYFSAGELQDLLRDHGFEVCLYGAFRTGNKLVRDRLVSWLKRTAVALNLIPKTMKGKEWLKRLFLGKLTEIPPEIGDGMAAVEQLDLIRGESPQPQYKVVYAIGRIA